MQGSHFLAIDRTGTTGSIVASGVVMRQINKDGTHFLCKTFKKGYVVSEVVSVEKMESLLLFDSYEDMNAWLADNAPPAPPPPVDNGHVARGCQQFALALAPDDGGATAPTAQLKAALSKENVS